MHWIARRGLRPLSATADSPNR